MFKLIKKDRGTIMQNSYIEFGYFNPNSSFVKKPGWCTVVKMWTNNSGNALRPEEMATEHLKNVLSYLSRIEVDKRDNSWLDAMNCIQSEYIKRNRKVEFISLNQDDASTVIKDMLRSMRTKTSTLRNVRIPSLHTPTHLLALAITFAYEYRFQKGASVSIDYNELFVKVTKNVTGGKSINIPVRDKLHAAFIILGAVGNVQHDKVNPPSVF